MIEGVATWTVTKAVESVDDSMTTAAVMGAVSETATFSAAGLPGTGALATGAAMGVGLNMVRKARRKRGREG